MSTLGMCLTGNSPAELGEAMINRRIQGKSWQEIADEFNLGSPSAARAKFKKLTGITDFKIKGAQLDKLVKNNLLDQIKGVAPKVAKKAVGQVDNALMTLEEKFKYAVKAKKEAFDAMAKGVYDVTGRGTAIGDKGFEIFNDYFSEGVKSYLKLSQKYGVPIKDIDEYIFRQLVVQHDGDIWKAYVSKPTSEFGFAEVQKLVYDLRAKGWTKLDIEDLFGVDKKVIQLIIDGKWKLPVPGSTSYVSSADTPFMPHVQGKKTYGESVTIFDGPIHTGTNFGFPKKNAMDSWIETYGTDMTQAQLNAVSSYTGSNYKGMNEALRGKAPMTPGYRSQIDEIDGIFRPTPKDITLRRDTGTVAFENFGGVDNIGGNVIFDKGIMSTTIKEGGVFGGEVTMIINVPAGCPARWVMPISSHAGEYEVLLPRETKMLVTKVVKDNSNHWIVYCQVVAA